MVAERKKILLEFQREVLGALKIAQRSLLTAGERRGRIEKLIAQMVDEYKKTKQYIERL